MRAKETIKPREYVSFYQSLSKIVEEPLSWTHFKAEGELDFVSLLYIPQKAPAKLQEQFQLKQSTIKLYVRRVLIKDEFDDLMPNYLKFIRGIVDSDDLPITVSRDSISQLKMFKVLTRKLVRKSIEMISKLADTEHVDEEEDEEEETEEEILDQEEQALDSENLVTNQT